MVYSQSDIGYIVSYAGEVRVFHRCHLNFVLTAVQRGIDVLIEIDTPGHTAVIGEAHPDFVACYHARPWADYAAGAQYHQPFLSQILKPCRFCRAPRRPAPPRQRHGRKLDRGPIRGGREDVPVVNDQHGW